MTPADPSDDDDRTVIRPARRGSAGHTLPPGTRLEDLEITGLIGEGGFGIVYLAYDASLERQVAVKEYMPGSLAARAVGTWQVSVKSERHRDTFEAGLKSFVNEAKLLARFDHPALVKVFRFWEANRTAYMAMPYYEGPTLKKALAERATPPDEAQLREWLRPLLDALALMHREQCYHRDIAPDNILLTSRGPLLLDFGAARRVIGGMTQALTVVLKPGYAPIEQYGESGAMLQGPWTDLYALASVVHCAITGHAPAGSPERIVDDPMQPLALTAAGRYSDGFLRAIDAALAVRPNDRPQDIAQFRALLEAGAPRVPPPAARAEPAPAARGSVAAPVTPPVTPARVAPVPAPAPVAAAPAGVAAAAPSAAAVGSRRAGLVLAALAVLALGGGAGVLLRRRGAADPAAVPAAPLADAPPAEAVAPAASVAATPAAIVEAPRAAPPPAAPLADAPPAAPLADPPPAAAPVIDTLADPAPASPAPAAPAAPTTAAVRPPRTATEPAPRRTRGMPSRCSDILQKASLEPLSPEETAYLKQECR